MIQKTNAAEYRFEKREDGTFYFSDAKKNSLKSKKAGP